MTEIDKQTVRAQMLLEQQAHIYTDKDLAEMVCALKSMAMELSNKYRYSVAERYGSAHATHKVYYVIECRSGADNVLVDIV